MKRRERFKLTQPPEKVYIHQSDQDDRGWAVPPSIDDPEDQMDDGDRVAVYTLVEVKRCSVKKGLFPLARTEYMSESPAPEGSANK